MNGYEARTKPTQARIILIAGRLVDSALAAEFCFDRNDRQAIRFDRAVATTFANQVVDDDKTTGILELATFSTAALQLFFSFVRGRSVQRFFGFEWLKIEQPIKRLQKMNEPKSAKKKRLLLVSVGTLG